MCAYLRLSERQRSFGTNPSAAGQAVCGGLRGQQKQGMTKLLEMEIPEASAEREICRLLHAHETEDSCVIDDEMQDAGAEIQRREKATHGTIQRKVSAVR